MDLPEGLLISHNTSRLEWPNYEDASFTQRHVSYFGIHAYENAVT